MTTNVVECKDCAYGREANVPNAVFCMLNHQTFSIPVYGCSNGRPGKIVPQTNADRIRSMSDEKLVELFQNLCCPYSLGGKVDCNIENRGCGNCWMSWLKSIAEEGEG